MAADSLLRDLPSIDRLLQHSAWAASLLPAMVRRDACRAVVDALRQEILGGECTSLPSLDALAAAARTRAETELEAQLRPVINATGVLLHTNLGRAPLPQEAIDAIVRCAGRYTNLEMDLEAGQRDSRHDRLTLGFARLLGCEDVAVVNNNAAAVFLALSSLAGDGRAVAISRGEQVEIGGSFRMPDIMEASGACLLEVGTTNRTRKADYEAAAADGAGVLLKVHRSNFDLVGFVESTSIEELVSVGRAHGVPVVYDLGSGRLEADSQDQAAVRAALQAGVDLVLFSGDKLLGGPQAGIAAGSRALVTQLKSHPLMRMLRPGKLTMLALEATLLAWARSPDGGTVPVAVMAALDAGVLKERAEGLARRIDARVAGRLGVEVEAVRSTPGGGSSATVRLPSWAVVLVPQGSDEELAARLRQYRKPVVARIEKGRVLLDLRTLLEGDEDELVDAVAAALD